MVNFNVAAWGGTDDSAAYFATAEATASRVLSLAPDNAFTHVILGLVLGFTKRAEQAMAHCERALALDRNLAAAHGMMGLYLVLLGRRGSGSRGAGGAPSQSSRSMAFAWLWSVMAKRFLDRPEEAVVWLRRSLDSNRNYPPTHFYLAAAFAQLGRPDEARSSVNAGLAVDQRFTLERFRLSAESDNPIYLARRERLIDHLRQAGVPEA
jgi:tetratricopeptide (TPR) repeat protein